MHWLLVLQQLLIQDVTEEDPDERHPPKELQLFGDQGHGLVKARREQDRGSASAAGWPGRAHSTPQRAFRSEEGLQPATQGECEGKRTGA